MYRDGLEGLRESARQQRELVAERDRKLVGLRRAILPDEEYEGLERLRTACLARAPNTLEDVTQLGAEITAWEVAIGAAERLASELLDVAECEPPFDPDDAPQGWYPADWPDGLVPALRRVAQQCRARMQPWGTGWGMQFDRDGVRFVLRGTSEPLDEAHRTVFLTLWSGTAPTIPKLALRPQTLGDRIARFVRLSGEADVGEPRFDGKFWVSGREDVARTLLVPPIRDALVEFAPSTPLFKIEAGLAKLSWMVEPKWYEHTSGVEDEDLILPRAAIDIHRTLRDLVRDARGP